MDVQILRLLCTGVTVLAVVIGSIASLIWSRHVREELSDSVSTITQDVDEGDSLVALERTVSLLKRQCELYPFDRETTLKLVRATIRSQVDALRIIARLCRDHSLDKGKQYVADLLDQLEIQAEISHDKRLVSWVHGGLKRGMVRAFEDAEARKRDLLPLLAVLAAELEFETD